MATKKAPGKAKKDASKKAAVKAPTTKASTKVSTKAVLHEDERVEVETAARYASPTEAQVRAFAGQLTEAAAEKRGQETKASGVVRDARAWVPIVDRVVQSGATVRYAPIRFAYFLLTIDKLARALDGAGKSGAGAARSLAEARAREMRTVLIEVLENLALGDDAAIAALAEARGTTTSPDELLKSLRNVVALAEAWLAKTDEPTVALVNSACLVQADVDAGQSAASALGAAIKDKTVVGVERVNDTAAVNRLEGRVTFEMAVVMRAFNNAAARGIGVRLVPGPATRRVLAPKKTETPAVAS